MVPGYMRRAFLTLHVNLVPISKSAWGSPEGLGNVRPATRAPWVSGNMASAFLRYLLNAYRLKPARNWPFFVRGHTDSSGLVCFHRTTSFIPISQTTRKRARRLILLFRARCYTFHVPVSRCLFILLVRVAKGRGVDKWMRLSATPQVARGLSP